MTVKGELAVAQDVYDALDLVLFFAGTISGSLYPKGCRPLNSKLEDAVISGVTLTADQIQEGTVKLNVYVPDVDNGSGRNVPNIGKLQEIEKMNDSLIDVLNSLSDEYRYWQGMAPAAIAEPETNEHFINFDIKFKRITF